MENEVELTILIPTYNRKNQLTELLRSIFIQGHFGEYKILISDNHSNYDVCAHVKSVFPNSFCEGIDYFTWKSNTGMATNISIPLFFIKTKWCWMLSDDDTITEGSLSRVLQEIKEYKEVLAIKYSLIRFKPHKDTFINSVDEFVDYYDFYGHVGEMMYLSFVYNMDRLYPYFSKVAEYSYSCLSFLLPVLFGLKDGGKMRLSSFGAINYRLVAEDNWAESVAIKVALGIRTITDVNFDIEDDSADRLYRLLTRGMAINLCIKAVLEIESKYYRNHVWKSLKPMFRINTSWSKRALCNIILCIYNSWGINIIPFYHKIKRLPMSNHI